MGFQKPGIHKASYFWVGVPLKGAPRLTNAINTSRWRLFHVWLFFRWKALSNVVSNKRSRRNGALFGGGWIVSKRDTESTRGYKMIFRSTTSCDSNTASSSIIISIITDDGAHIPPSLFDLSSIDYGSSHAISDADFSCAVSAISRFNIYEKTTPVGCHRLLRSEVLVRRKWRHRRHWSASLPLTHLVLRRRALLWELPRHASCQG